MISSFPLLCAFPLVNYCFLICRNPTPSLDLGIAHNYGVVRGMQWCPSGCWESESTTPITGSVSLTTNGVSGSCADDLTSSGELLQRMGLLAVACSDGKLRILR